MKNDLDEKEKAIRMQDKKTKENRKFTEKSNWDELKEANKILKKELKSSGYEKYSETHSLFQELKDTTNVMIDIIHSNACWHSYFKSRLLCSKRLKNMIENQEFPETLLRVMKLLIDILELNKDSFASTRITTQRFDSPKSSPRYLSPPQKNVENNKNTSGNYRNPPEFYQQSDSIQKISCWTQTQIDENIISFKSKQKLQISDLEDSKRHKSNQTSFEGEKSRNQLNSDNKSILGPLRINKSIQVPNSNPFTSKMCPNIVIENETSSFSKKSFTGKPINKKVYTPQNNSKRLLNILESNREESLGGISEFKPINPKSDEDYMKLIDESQQLLNIIDKQSDRLSKINTQISQLVPVSFETSEHGVDEEFLYNSDKNQTNRTNNMSRTQLVSSMIEKNSECNEKLYGENSPKNERKRSG